MNKQAVAHVYSKGLGVLLSTWLLAVSPAQAQETLSPQNKHQDSPTPVNISTGMIQTAGLNSEVPLFVPTHPRVTTTLRFPEAIGAPEGRGFTEDENKVPGEYLVAWTRGDSHLTVTPLPGAAALNLNIPYKGDTYVVYFYPVERQFQALASLRLVQAPTNTRQAPGTVGNEKQSRIGGIPATRLLGLLDKVKLLRAVAPGKGQSQLAATLGLELACPSTTQKTEYLTKDPASPDLEILITHVVRDPSLGALAFALRLINHSKQVLTLGGVKFTAYCGGKTFQQGMAEVPALLSASEETEGFLTIETEALSPFRAENPWLVRTLGASTQAQDPKSAEREGIQGREKEEPLRPSKS